MTVRIGKRCSLSESVSTLCGRFAFQFSAPMRTCLGAAPVNQVRKPSWPGTLLEASDRASQRSLDVSAKVWSERGRVGVVGPLPSLARHALRGRTSGPALEASEATRPIRRSRCGRSRSDRCATMRLLTNTRPTKGNRRCSRRTRSSSGSSNRRCGKSVLTAT